MQLFGSRGLGLLVSFSRLRGREVRSVLAVLFALFFLSSS